MWTVRRTVAALVWLALPSVAVAQTPGQPIPNQYIVVLNDQQVASAQVGAIAETLSRAEGGRLLRHFEHALRGFALSISATGAAALARNPLVRYVEQDRVVSADFTQTGATWGLDRIDQRDLALNGTYNYEQTGGGVHAYIIDTGIRATHTEFAGRISDGFSSVVGGTNDCNGHGTHVAGTVGGSTYGVAKEVTLHPVRVLDCNGSGSTSGVIAGVDWVTNNHRKPAVANMSLGGGASTALDDAVRNSIFAGVTYAISAGNSNANACGSSPGRVSQALTIGASTNADSRSSFSNFGACVDLFAPGSNITSAWFTNDTATNTISGTSMAAPHVAGVAALYLAVRPTASAANVHAAIVDNASVNKLSGVGVGSPNLLLYSIFDLPVATLTVNGSSASQVVLPPAAPLNVSISFDAGSASALNPAEIYVGLVAPFSPPYFWLQPTLTFVPSLAPVRLFTGPLPTFGPATIVSLANSSVLPSGSYTWFIVVDNDANGVIDGTTFDFTEVVIP